MKFAQIREFENVLEFPEKVKGKWKQEVFGNDNPIVLEIGCGKGVYTLEQARHNLNQNFIGIDRKGERLWRGAKTALDENLNNVRFLRCFIENIDDFFRKDEVDEIWITFPDPLPKDRWAKRRLTSPNFLSIYKEMVKKGGLIHLKTDDLGLFEYSLEMMQEAGLSIQCQYDDLYSQKILDSRLSIKTDYEKYFLSLGKKIKYISALV